MKDGIVFGRYLLLAPIGRGGMAEVWRAKLVGTGDFARQVVVKRILPHLAADPDFSRMFTSEAELCARLHHPNIVQVFEFSSVGSELYLVMEYVDGVDLLRIMRRVPADAQIPLGLAAQVVRDVCRALAYAHPMEIIHRDISPSNIMLTFEGTVKLLDFGVAKCLSSTDQQTRTGLLKGKLGYLSPEAASGAVELDRRADIFSSGVILHELLTGKRLFKGRDEMHSLAMVRECAVQPPSASRPGISPTLDQICMKALAKERAQRFATADEMATALTDVLREMRWDEPATAAFLRQLDVRAAPVLAPAAASTITSNERPLREVARARRWPLLVAVGGAVAVAGVIAAVYLARVPPPIPPAIPPPVAAAAPPPPVLTKQPEPAVIEPPPPPPRTSRKRHRSSKPKPEPAPTKRGPDLIKGDVDSDFDR